MPERNPTPDQALHAIAGRWQTSGEVVGEPGTTVVGTDTYEVLVGGHFLVHHVDVTVGDGPVRAIEIIGEPDPAGGYLARSFDSDGNAELMHLTIDERGVFHFAGGGDIATAAQPAGTSTARVRSTLTVAEDRRSMRALWERSEDGIAWAPWMDIAFRNDSAESSTDTVPAPHPELRRLEPLIGTWRCDDRTEDTTLFGSGVPVTSADRFSWLDGGYFLVQSYETAFGDEPPQQGINYWYYDAGTGTFRIIFFSNNGPFTENGNRYQGRVGDSTLTFVGPARFQYALDEDGLVAVNPDGTISVVWSIRADAGEWEPWMVNTFTRVD
ncbi:hypothetical protein ACIBL3_39605 [Kribbella sp. NPDC050124]|uniref:hypothetical protein n=1 Tax=Kribbella sp. NPDC050124 TaxID=3364114 RepID=UPI00379A2AA2